MPLRVIARGLTLVELDEQLALTHTGVAYAVRIDETGGQLFDDLARGLLAPVDEEIGVEGDACHAPVVIVVS